VRLPYTLSAKSRPDAKRGVPIPLVWGRVE
jgi:hypothetical protein